MIGSDGMDDRKELDRLISELTAHRRAQVQARADYQAAMRRGEEARVQAQQTERLINAQIDKMTNARLGETFGIEQGASTAG